MATKRKTLQKNFRFLPKVCRFLEQLSVKTGKSQSRLVLDAIEHFYKIKGMR